MKKWQIALQKFIKKWESKKDVVGAVVCGSYITGNPTKHSDIDVQILLDSKTPWRERGNKIIDGILIEYFANPVTKIQQYFEEDYKERRKISAHMFCSGKVLFDKTGELKKIIKDAKKYFTKKYPHPSNIQIEMAKYHIWDRRDNLEEIYETNADEFSFVFFNDLNELFEAYSRFLRFDSVQVHKLKRFIVNGKDKKKYDVGDFPDKKFVKMFVKAINIKDKSEMMKEYQKLTNHVLKKMGGFNVDGWKLKSSAK